MSPTPPNVELIESKSIEVFIPVMREVNLGDNFLLSMLHWCGIGRRATPLEYWQVFLVQHAAKTVGVIGLYRQLGMDQSLCWIGWFGIRPRFRRQGCGASAIQHLVEFARDIGCRTLWVYTESTNRIAIQFYQKLGFAVVGSAGQCASGQTMDASDIVLSRAI